MESKNDWQRKVPDNNSWGRLDELWNSMVQPPVAIQHSVPGGGTQAVLSDHGNGDRKSIVIHRANRTKIKFVESNSGVFYFEMNDNSKTESYVTD